MGGEAERFLKVWIVATLCLCYCYYVAARIQKGLMRFLSLLPVFYIFILLPFNLTTTHLCCLTAFLLVWLGSFKLLLFSLGQGPLSPLPPKLFHFICLACLPIKLKNTINHHPSPRTNLLAATIIIGAKLSLLALILGSYSYKHLMNHYVVLLIYCFHTYIELEILLAIVAIPARILFGFELERQFNEPYLSSSLQDFWSRRWNIMVSSILRQAVYFPTRHFFTPAIGSSRATLVALVAAFSVSGLMHEILYYYVLRVSPTWEVTCFFILQGVSMAIEVAVKKAVKDRWRLPVMISRPLALAFVGITGFWLFFPQIVRNGGDEKLISELYILTDFIKGGTK